MATCFHPYSPEDIQRTQELKELTELFAPKFADTLSANINDIIGAWQDKNDSIGKLPSNEEFFEFLFNGVYDHPYVNKDNIAEVAATHAEMAEIRKQAKENGTYMLAPNGKRSNLNERQWLQVRTKAFKDWFGDWENNGVTVSKSTRTDTYLIYKDGNKIGSFHIDEKRGIIYSVGLDSNFREKGLGKYAYIAANRELNRNGIILKSRPNPEDGNPLHPNAKKIWQNLIKEGLAKKTEYGYDMITDTSVSKVVDENGEPLVVYHSGDKNWTYNIFKTKTGYKANDFFYFSSDKNTALTYQRWDIDYIKRLYNNSPSKSIIYETLSFKESIKDENGKFIKNRTLSSEEVDKLPITEVYNELRYQYGKKIANTIIDINNEKYLNPSIETLLSLADTINSPHDKNKFIECLNIIKEIKSKSSIDTVLTTAAFLNIRNNNSVTLDAKGKNWHEYNEYLGWDYSFNPEYYVHKLNQNANGFIMENIKDSRSENDKRIGLSTTYAVRNSNQIKSATDNIGTFSKTDDNIQGFYVHSTSNSRFNSLITKIGFIIEEQEGDGMFDIYALFLNSSSSFKEFISTLQRGGIDIEYTDNIRMVDEQITPEEFKKCVKELREAEKEDRNSIIEEAHQNIESLGFEDGKTYTWKEVYDKLEPIMNPAAKAVWEIISPIVEKLGLSVTIDSKTLTNTHTVLGGFFNPKTGEVIITGAVGTYNVSFIGEVLVHELTHAVTTKIIEAVNEGKTEGLSQKQIDAVNKMQKLYKEVRAKGGYESYEFGNIFEFVAHLTNEGHKRELQSYEKNFLEKFFDFLKDLFGISNAYDLSMQYLKDMIGSGEFLYINGIKMDSGNDVQGLAIRKDTSNHAQNVIQNPKGENISSNGSEFARQLTNPGNNLTVEYKGYTFRNAEHAYQTWKSGEFDETAYKSTAFKPKGSKKVNKAVNFDIMVEILIAKLQQHPELIQGITDRGGLNYINNSTHNVTGDTYWESSGKNKFIEALAKAYMQVSPASSVTSTIKETVSQIPQERPLQTPIKVESKDALSELEKNGNLKENQIYYTESDSTRGTTITFSRTRTNPQGKISVMKSGHITTNLDWQKLFSQEDYESYFGENGHYRADIIGLKSFTISDNGISFNLRLHTKNTPDVITSNGKEINIFIQKSDLNNLNKDVILQSLETPLDATDNPFQNKINLGRFTTSYQNLWEALQQYTPLEEFMKNEKTLTYNGKNYILKRTQLGDTELPLWYQAGETPTLVKIVGMQFILLGELSNVLRTTLTIQRESDLKLALKHENSKFTNKANRQLQLRNNIAEYIGLKNGEIREIIEALSAVGVQLLAEQRFNFLRACYNLLQDQNCSDQDYQILVSAYDNVRTGHKWAFEYADNEFFNSKEEFKGTLITSISQILSFHLRDLQDINTYIDNVISTIGPYKEMSDKTREQFETQLTYYFSWVKNLAEENPEIYKQVEEVFISEALFNIGDLLGIKLEAKKTQYAVKAENQIISDTEDQTDIDFEQTESDNIEEVSLSRAKESGYMDFAKRSSFSSVSSRMKALYALECADYVSNGSSLTASRTILGLRKLPNVKQIHSTLNTLLLNCTTIDQMLNIVQDSAKQAIYPWLSDIADFLINEDSTTPNIQKEFFSLYSNQRLHLTRINISKNGKVYMSELNAKSAMKQLWEAVEQTFRSDRYDKLSENSIYTEDGKLRFEQNAEGKWVSPITSLLDEGFKLRTEVSKLPEGQIRDNGYNQIGDIIEECLLAIGLNTALFPSLQQAIHSPEILSTEIGETLGTKDMVVDRILTALKQFTGIDPYTIKDDKIVHNHEGDTANELTNFIQSFGEQKSEAIISSELTKYKEEYGDKNIYTKEAQKLMPILAKTPNIDLKVLYQKDYSALFESLSPYIEIGYEDMAREKGSSYYAYQNPSWLDVFLKEIKTLEGSSHEDFQKWLINTFSNDPLCASKNIDGTVKWLNPILQYLYDSQTGKDYMAALTKITPKFSRGKEIKNWEKIDYYLAALSLYGTSRWGRYRGFLLPVISDASAVEGINGPELIQDKKDLIKQATSLVLGEYNRICAINTLEQYIADHPEEKEYMERQLPKHYIANGKRFLHFPELNTLKVKTIDGEEKLFIEALHDAVDDIHNINQETAEALVEKHVLKILNQYKKQCYFEFKQLTTTYGYQEVFNQFTSTRSAKTESENSELSEINEDTIRQGLFSLFMDPSDLSASTDETTADTDTTTVENNTNEDEIPSVSDEELVGALPESTENTEEQTEEEEGYGLSTLFDEWFANDFFQQAAWSSIINGDFAQYKDAFEYVKRMKQFHTPLLRNTAQMPARTVTIKTKGGNTVINIEEGNESYIVLADTFMQSSNTFAVETIVKESSLSSAAKQAIKALWKDSIAATDGQAFRSLSSYLKILQLYGKNTYALESLINKIKNKEPLDWADFETALVSIKDLFSGIENKSIVNSQGEALLQYRSFQQHKNSEAAIFISSVFRAMFDRSEEFLALQDFMESTGIDVVLFASNVKVGDKTKHLDLSVRGELSIQEYLKFHIAESPYLVEQRSLKNYGIATATADHVTDKQRARGTQLVRLMMGDLRGFAEENTPHKKDSPSPYKRFIEDHKHILQSLNFAELKQNEYGKKYWAVSQENIEKASTGTFSQRYIETFGTPQTFTDAINWFFYGYLQDRNGEITIKYKKPTNKTEDRIIQEEDGTLKTVTKTTTNEFTLSLKLTPIEYNLKGHSYNLLELKKFYWDLLGANVEEAFENLKSKFNNIEELQAFILDALDKSTRYDDTLKQAFEIVEIVHNGEVKKTFKCGFNHPLIANEIEPFLFSLLKENVIKQYTRGGEAVQVSALGLNDLNMRWKNSKGEMMMSQTEFENSDLKDTYPDYSAYVKAFKPSSCAYLECYLPPQAKTMYEDLLVEKKDETGETYWELDTTQVPEELLKVIGYRVPTENKYSIANLRIKGFLPPGSGIVMLPHEWILLSGSDFDIDKLYLIFKEFTKKSIDLETLLGKRAELHDFYNGTYYETYWNLFLDSIKDHKNFKELELGKLRSLTSWEEIKTEIVASGIADTDKNHWFTLLKNGFKSYVDNAKIAGKKLKTSEWVIEEYDFEKPMEQNSRAQRNNMIFDIMEMVLSHPETAPNYVNPGGFEPLDILTCKLLCVLNWDKFKKKLDILKATKNIPDKSRSQSRWEYVNSIFTAHNIKDLKDLARDFKADPNPFKFTSRAESFTNNREGGELIPAHATHNVHLPMFQGYYDYEITPITIGGIRYTSLGYTFNSSGEYVSRTLAMYIAAAVDNGKNPVLKYLFQSPKTAYISDYLARLGVPAEHIALLLLNPVIQQCFKVSLEQKVPLQAAVDIVKKDIETYHANKGYEIKGIAGFTCDEKIMGKLLEYSYGKIKEFAFQPPGAKVYLNPGVQFLHLFSTILRDADGLNKQVGRTRTDNADTGAFIHQYIDSRKKTSLGDWGNPNLSYYNKLREIYFERFPHLVAPYYDLLSSEVLTFVENNLLDWPIAHQYDWFRDLSLYKLMDSDFFKSLSLRDIALPEGFTKKFTIGRATDFDSLEEKMRWFTDELPKHFDIIINKLKAEPALSKVLHPEGVSNVASHHSIIYFQGYDGNRQYRPSIRYTNMALIKQNKVQMAKIRNELNDMISGNFVPESVEMSAEDRQKFNKLGEQLAKILLIYSVIADGFATNRQSFQTFFDPTFMDKIPGYTATLATPMTEEELKNYHTQFIVNHLERRGFVKYISEENAGAKTLEKALMNAYKEQAESIKIDPVALKEIVGRQFNQFLCIKTNFGKFYLHAADLKEGELFILNPMGIYGRYKQYNPQQQYVLYKTMNLYFDEINLKQQQNVLAKALTLDMYAIAVNFTSNGIKIDSKNGTSKYISLDELLNKANICK